VVNDKLSFALDLAGQHWEIQITRDELEGVHLPLLRRFAGESASRPGRCLVLLAGPPGSGKTTLGALWESLAKTHAPDLSIRTLPMDGFHYPNRVLDAETVMRDGCLIPLRKIKGAPESFDLSRLTESLQAIVEGKALHWPKYDRQIHDPVPEAIAVPAQGMLLVEGNYVLLDEDGWRDLSKLAALTIFVGCGEPCARERVLARLQRGGRSPEDALRHYEFNDFCNWERVMQQRVESDIVLQVREEERLIRVK
jgi:pantothenate kinase